MVVILLLLLSKSINSVIEKFSRLGSWQKQCVQVSYWLVLERIGGKRKEVSFSRPAGGCSTFTQWAKISNFSDLEQIFFKKSEIGLVFPTVHRLLYWGILPLCCGLIVASSDENPSLPFGLVLLPGVWADVPREIPSSPLVKSFKSSEAVAPRGLSSPWKHKWHFSKFNFKHHPKYMLANLWCLSSSFEVQLRFDFLWRTMQWVENQFWSNFHYHDAKFSRNILRLQFYKLFSMRLMERFFILQ